MTKAMMALSELAEKTPDADVLRQMIRGETSDLAPLTVWPL